MAAKKFGLKCKIFMGAKDIKRQRPNVEAIRKNGAKIVPVTSGSQTLVDAVSECMRYWVSNCDTTHMCVGSTVGPNIFIKICAWSTAQISRELIHQVKEEFGIIPKKIKSNIIVWVVEVQQWAFGMNSWILMLNLSVLKLEVQKKQVACGSIN